MRSDSSRAGGQLSRQRVFVLAAVVAAAMLCAAIGWRILPSGSAGDAAQHVANDAPRFDTVRSSVQALQTIRSESLTQRTHCLREHGAIPQCQAWASVAAYVTVAASVSFDCTLAGRDQVRRQIAAYIVSVRAMSPDAPTAPDPPGPPRCR